jgi:phytoene desaturase
MKSIIIGSGFGGIAAALRLKSKGHSVTLIEKHKDLGGRARVFRKGGFTFDAGPTVITAPFLIDELFSLFNKDPKKLY